MDLNRLLLWMAGVSCTLNLLFTFRASGPSLWSWRAILTGLLITLILGVIFLPAYAGFIVGIAWFLLVLLPILIQRLASRLLAGRRYRAALACAKISAWLHPFDAWSDHPEIIRALRMYHEGQEREATAILSRLEELDTPIGRLAVIMRAQQTGDWEKLLAWLRQKIASNTYDENLALAELQALGELGRRDEMLLRYRQLLGGPNDAADASVGMIALRVSALSGASIAVDQITDALSSATPRDAQEYWRLTARQVEGSTEAVEGFHRLQSWASPYLQSMIQRRIANPLPPRRPGQLSESAQSVLDELVRRIDHETRYAVLDGSSGRRPYATWTIAMVLIAVFLLEIPGGTTNPMNLIRLGALVIPTVYTPGQWWRVLTAGLLHFGPLHLLMNLLGLFFFGPRLERAWGSLKMAACYIAATVISMGLAPYLATVPQGLPYVPLAGASGGVMGLLGGIIGHLAIGRWRGRSQKVSRQLSLLLLIVVLQTAFDLTTPNVSFACHAMGLLTGFCFAMGLLVFRLQKP